MTARASAPADAATVAGEPAEATTGARWPTASPVACRAAASCALRRASALRIMASLALVFTASRFAGAIGAVFLIGRTGTPGERHSSQRRVSSRRAILPLLALASNHAPQSGQLASDSDR